MGGWDESLFQAECEIEKEFLQPGSPPCSRLRTLGSVCTLWT